MDSKVQHKKKDDNITKEMDNIDCLHVFKYLPPTKEFPKSEGWQKHTYLIIMTCDVSNNALFTTNNPKQVWKMAWDEFGEKKGYKLEILWASYEPAGS